MENVIKNVQFMKFLEMMENVDLALAMRLDYLIAIDAEKFQMDHLNVLIAIMAIN